ncbi:methionine adenosyltransferase [Nocardia gipuzkoensis]|uniref:methionine adenosyltransferase n=1 Tax=Nocardia gipuzkoensis TaxID=2749991 RepID=UPI00237E5664|nr:methionine adenosyltransferase [Nocardia gipuzkoensis]MDE1675329.1 methionine adenosyltransferase [Nocardia gipuzkoensis]
MHGIFTSESVFLGHPDKVADQVSDAILDAYLIADKQSRVAVETLVSATRLVVAGEVTSKANLDVPSIVRGVLTDIGYSSNSSDFNGFQYDVDVLLKEQDRNIANSVRRSYETRNDSASDELDLQGAGDQGTVFGYACDETPELMPLPVSVAHQLAERVDDARRQRILPFLGPDGKTQVSIQYRDGHPVNIRTVVLSCHHQPGFRQDLIVPAVHEHVVNPCFEQLAVETDNCRVIVNPQESFDVGGPAADTGLTGRKIIVDSYGGMARHGGGAFSGKDPSKVDRSGAYAARWIAKNVVAAGLAKRCEVQITYVISMARPTDVAIECFGTESVPLFVLETAIKRVFDLRPAAVIRDLDLLRPIYRKTACYGHFGRELPEFSWECTNRVESLLHGIREANAIKVS